MPIAAPFTGYCPLLLEGDYLSLSGNLVIKKSLLCDRTVGAAHHVSPGGRILVAALKRGILYRDLLLLAEENKLLTSAVADMLGFINLTGSLGLKRTHHAKITALRLRLLGYCTGLRFAPLAWRQQLALSKLFYGLLRACWPVLLAGSTVALVAASSGLIVWPEAMYLLGSSTAVFVASIYFHEFGHAIRIQNYGVDCDVIQRGLRFGLLHRRMEPRAEITVAFAGPIWGCAVCVAGSIISMLLNERFLLVISLVTALIHIFSFLPWYSDGASIRYALSKRSQI